ncbi:hypothetical protein BC936DRAFT_146004 [Jimgerdemannia flammicorona]|uniref:Secreted protein n=1 Tax=Jimgerdemannia flammicorona TaxID=994334 RepID=A0A433D8L4_9FUNG|nr:hypothetical protein BC936DRAFT_146004 [Jimgerdemannia flammicorona]
MESLQHMRFFLFVWFCIAKCYTHEVDQVIASEVGIVAGVKRLPKQYRAHYQRKLDPMLVKDPWTAQGDKILVDANNRSANSPTTAACLGSISA